MEEDCCSHQSPAWLVEAVAEWEKLTLPNLRNVQLDSAYACSSSHCECLDFAFKSFLSCADIKVLTVKHLQDVCKHQSPHTTQSRTIPKQLHLLITTMSHEASPDMDIHLKWRQAFFNNRLNSTWLEPMQSQLTHMTLHCNTYWGVYPRWQASRLHFPALKSLALGKWSIAFDWQVDFIVSLGQTLEQLILTDCPILHASRMRALQIDNKWELGIPGTSRGKPPTSNLFFDLRWHHLLPDFEDKLPKLKHFSMGRGPVGDHYWGEADLSGDEAFDDRYTLAPCIDASRYAIFDFDDGPIEYEDPNPGLRVSEPGDKWSWLQRETDEEVKKKVRYPDCLKEDQEALEGLLEALRKRN